MKKILVLLFVLLSLSQALWAQKSMNSMKYFKQYDVPINRNITINYGDYFVYVNILEDDPDINAKEHLFYYWYGANDVKRTKGGYSGKLLHGAYTEYYPNKDLKGQGMFRYGLKHGEWKSWHQSGEYDEISYWKHGMKHGLARFYNDKGELIRESNYKNDELHGKTKVYDINSIEIIKYRHGRAHIKVKEKKHFLGRYKKESANQLKVDKKKAKIDRRWQKLKDFFNIKETKQKNEIEDKKKKEDRKEYKRQQKLKKNP